MPRNRKEQDYEKLENKEEVSEKNEIVLSDDSDSESESSVQRKGATQKVGIPTSDPVVEKKRTKHTKLELDAMEKKSISELTREEQELIRRRIKNREYRNKRISQKEKKEPKNASRIPDDTEAKKEDLSKPVLARQTAEPQIAEPVRQIYRRR